MKTIEELLKNLSRPEVLEFGLVTNRLPSVNIGGKFEPVDDEAPSNERLMAMLVTMGGSRYVDSLSDKPVQWTTKLEGVGVIAVAAILRKDIVQARFTVAKREGGPASAPARPSAPGAPGAQTTQPQAKPPVPSAASGAGPAAKPAAQSARNIPAVPPTPQPTAAKSTPAVPAARPAAPPTSTPMTSAKATQQMTPQVIKSVTAAAAAPSTTTRAAPPASTTTAAAAPVASPPAPAVAPPPVPVPPPPEEEWDDDDEPTLQTLSPPVVPPHMMPPEPPKANDAPKAKPARRPEEVAAEEKAAADKAAAEKAAADKVAADKAAAEKAAADKVAAEKAAADKAAADKVAAEKAAADKAAADKAAAEKAAADRAAAEKAARERAEQERQARERAEQERQARERAEQERVAREAEHAEQERAAHEAAERAAAERAAVEKAAAEKAAADARAAEERATAERVARERAAAQEAARVRAQQAAQPAPRRISTPTSMDAIDVEITQSQPGSAKNIVDHDADGTEDTVSLPGGVDVARAAQVAEAQAKARGPVPTTTAPNIPEKDRPRVEASAAIDSFLAMAVAARATDLIIVAGRPVLLRVASDLLPRTQTIAAEQVERIAKEIVPARLREALEKEGSCDFAVEHLTHGRFRVNVSRQRTGVKLTLRVIAKELPTLASLGLPEAVAGGIRFQSGVVLIAGPAGHGKSSTLAALIDQINRESSKHVATIEEPIEHVHPRKKGLVSQRDVGLHTRTKARAFHSSLRSDPDVVVISELRDAEAVRLALTAAEGGRLVLGTINAPGAAAAIERMLRFFPKPDDHWARTTLASTLRLVIGQQLVPSADRTRLHAAVELLPSSPALWSALKAGRVPDAAALKPKSRNVVLLDEALADLVRAQKVTNEVAKHYAEAPADFEALVARREIAVMAVIDPILDELIKRGGTDLHLAVNQPPLGRVRGDIAPLRDQPTTAKELEEMLLELVTPAQRQRLAADLDLDLAIQFKDVARFRASYYVKHSGIAASFRLVPSRVPSLTELGLPEVLWRLADRRSGLILVAGPSASGKTTTAAAMVDHINKTRAAHVLTLENPIEFVHESLRAQITQREIGTHAPTLAAALKSAPRENPDVIVISDLPAVEDMEAVLKLAGDGILVIVTVLAGSAAAALERVITGVPADRQRRLQDLLADCLAGVVIQHLIRSPDGKSRVAAHEVLVSNAAITTIVRDGKLGRIGEALVAGAPQGMQTLDASLERLLEAQKITPESALERATDKETFADVIRRTRPDLVD